jgi:RNA polymerase sigma factor (sigma-70 family)
MTDVERLRSPDKFGPWFYGITLNVARKWLRQLQAERPGLPDPPSEATDPAEAAEIADTAARVRRAIAALANGQQEAVRLFYLQGLSHREVAEELGISVGAVKARLHQARAALAPRLVEFAIPTTTEAITVATTAEVEWAEVSVRDILRTQHDDIMQREHVMLLAERGGDRQLPIWIGPAEAAALALVLESVETPRPFPYKMAAGLVDAAGARVTEVRITQLIAPIFYALVVVEGPGGPREVDARPSDAVNLAMVTGAPVRVNAELFAVMTPGTHDAIKARKVMRSATSDIAAETQQRMAERAKGHGRPAEGSESAEDGGTSGQ